MRDKDQGLAVVNAWENDPPHRECPMCGGVARLHYSQLVGDDGFLKCTTSGCYFAETEHGVPIEVWNAPRFYDKKFEELELEIEALLST